MASHRTTARGVLFLAAILGLVAGTAAASTNKLPAHIIFPVVGQVQYADDFGQPRPGGPHRGNDLMAAKKSPAVAVEAGKVKYWTTSASAGCMLYLYGQSGTTYYYIHLNNDRTMRNDNRGTCVQGTAYAVKDGSRVAAGQQIGYVGDSGDANGVLRTMTSIALAQLDQRVVVWTQPAPATLKAQRGDPGALTAALIQVG